MSDVNELRRTEQFKLAAGSRPRAATIHNGKTSKWQQLQTSARTLLPRTPLPPSPLKKKVPEEQSLSASHGGIWRSGGIVPFNLNPSTTWGWVVSLRPRPLYLRYPLNRRLGSPRSRCGRFGDNTNLLLPRGIEPRFLRLPARSLVTTRTTLFRPAKLPGTLWT